MKRKPSTSLFVTCYLLTAHACSDPEQGSDVGDPPIESVSPSGGTSAGGNTSPASSMLPSSPVPTPAAPASMSPTVNPNSQPPSAPSIVEPSPSEMTAPMMGGGDQPPVELAGASADGGAGGGSPDIDSGSGGSRTVQATAGAGGLGGSPGMAMGGNAPDQVGGAAGVEASGGGGTGGDANAEGCPKAGNVEYEFVDIGGWPADALERITPALDEAMSYYNCYSELSHTLTVAYNPGVQTAEANVDGRISFGSDRDYMVVATVMHEIGHTMGVGYYPWSELIVDMRWTGQHVNDLMASIPPEQRDSDEGQRDYITADSLHFWPYGLNYASEHESEWSLINHVKIVDAMNLDKADYLAR